MADTPTEDLRDAMADADGDGSDEGEGDEEPPEPEPEGTIASRVRGLRNRLRDRRVRRNAKQAKRRANNRRRKKRLKEAVLPGSDQTREEAREEVGELADEVGVTRERAGGLVQQARSAAARTGDTISLDLDNDGDVDLIAGAAGSVEAVATRREPDVNDPPVGDIEDDFGEVGAAGIEAELGLDEPIEEDFDGLFR